ncbi:hypothetical protein EVJ32_10890 [Exiguobacterium sp. SH5S4]|jgi:hypothetical protein|uniref:hypothetical protein n=1 Tax=Exiguobacterium sp. SH5S4 TaxID=2510961 RepID=UPI00103E10C6|nr:hypothetical protein [Exiguobacterium sp. SH5S4]TCI25297.1 hypothetical protein EVJ32_10890 [Exiguobacterium sp. SH5S4]
MSEERKSILLFAVVMTGVLLLILTFVDRSGEKMLEKAMLNWDVEHQESVAIENVHFSTKQFRGKQIMFDTNEGTIVLDMENVHYLAKTEDESRMNMTIFKEKDGERERAVLVVYVNENDLKLVSKNYAEAFSSTLTLDNVEPTITKLPDNYIDLSKGWDSPQVIE